MKKFLLVLTLGLLALTVAACNRTVDPDPDPDPDPDRTAPVISGASNVTIEVGATFDPLAGVTATDTEDGSLTVTVTGTVNTNQVGTYTLTYRATNSEDMSTTVTRVVTVRYPFANYPDQSADFKFATPELRNTLFAYAERWLLTTVNGGVPLFANSTFAMYSDRVQLPVDEFVPVMGYGVAYGTMTEDDSTVIMDNNQLGNAGEYTYRGTIGSNPETFNQWIYQGSVTSDLMGLFLDSPYRFVFNATKDGYQIVPSMAEAMPVPVDAETLDTGIEVAKVWRIPLREDLAFFPHPNAATELGLDFSGWDLTIDANDFVNTYKLAMEQEWPRAVAGGGDFLTASQRIVGARGFVDGELDWEDVGIKVHDDYTVEFTFVNNMSEWNVIYWLSSFVMSPINIDLYYALTTIDGEGAHTTTYGTDEFTIFYTGPYYVSFYQSDSIVRMLENPNFHDEDLYFYTGRTFEVHAEAEVIFEMFLNGLLDGTGVPTVSYEDYRNDPRLVRVPGATAFRLNINGLGTVENQRAHFEDSPFVPEPLLADAAFKRALYFGVNRTVLARDIMKTAEPMPFIFSSAYVVDAAEGTAFRNTTQSSIVNPGLSISTQGYNPDLARAYFNDAINRLVANGTYQPGTVTNPTIIEIGMVIQAGSTAQALMADYLIDTYEQLFNSTTHNVVVTFNITPAPFPNNYFDYIIPGNFDTGTGGISGSTLDAASFLDVFMTDNRSGFTLNFGFDSNTPDIPVTYTNLDGDVVTELWSFDALAQALVGPTTVVDGKLVE
ncbi:MAG: ABC transporter substrate-binding protein [Candidatus Izemoplasmataceae bacterium]